MADEQIIAASIKVETGDANASVKEFNENVNTAKDSLNTVGQTVNNTNKQVQSAGSSFSNLRDQMSAIPGPVGAVTSASGKLNGILQILSKNPLVLTLTLIVGALTLLYKAFKSTEDGADKLEQVFSGLSAVVDIILNRILKAGSAIVKFFTGDFSGALDDAKAAVTGFADEAVAEFNRAVDAAKRLQDLDDVVRDLGVSRAKLNKDLAATKEILSDENATLKEKKQAIADIRKAEEAQTAAEVAAAEERLAIAKEELEVKAAQNKATDEIRDNFASAQKELYAIQQEQAANTEKFNSQERSLDKQHQAELKEARDKAAEEEKTRRQNLADFKLKLAKLEQENQLAQIKDSFERERQALQFRIEEERKANADAVKERRITREQERQLNAALDIKADLEARAITDKQNKDLLEKQAAYEKELADVRKRIRIGAITDQNELERVQLQIGYEEKLQDALKRYADDQARFFEVKTLIDEEYRQQQAALEEEIRIENEEKELERNVAIQEKVVADREASFEAQRAALDVEQALFDEALANKVISEEAYNQKTQQLADARVAIGEREAQARSETIARIGDAFGTLSDLVGKQTAVGKGLAIAQATISTFQSAVSSFNSLSGIPIVGPALGAIAAAGAIASGIANVKKILAVKVPGQADQGGSVPTPTAPPTAPTAPLQPQQQSTRLDPRSISELGDVTKNGQATVRAYVVDTDVENNAERNARLNRAARLGG